MFKHIFAAAVLLSVSFSGTVGAAANPQANHPGYWGDTCTKTEMGGEVMKYTAPADATKVIVKGGTGNQVYDQAPFTDLTAPVNPKNGKNYAISHVIVCTGAATVAAPQPVQPLERETVQQETPKGGAATSTQVKTVAPQAAAPVATPAVLPEAGGSIYGTILSALAAVVAGYVTKRRLSSRFAA